MDAQDLPASRSSSSYKRSFDHIENGDSASSSAAHRDPQHEGEDATRHERHKRPRSEESSPSHSSVGAVDVSFEPAELPIRSLDTPGRHGLNPTLSDAFAASSTYEVQARDTIGMNDSADVSATDSIDVFSSISAPQSSPFSSWNIPSDAVTLPHIVSNSAFNGPDLPPDPSSFAPLEIPLPPSNTARVSATVATQSDTDDRFRISMERFNTFDGHLSILRNSSHGQDETALSASSSYQVENRDPHTAQVENVWQASAPPHSFPRTNPLPPLSASPPHLPGTTYSHYSARLMAARRRVHEHIRTHVQPPVPVSRPLDDAELAHIARGVEVTGSRLEHVRRNWEQRRQPFEATGEISQPTRRPPPWLVTSTPLGEQRRPIALPTTVTTPGDRTSHDIRRETLMSARNLEENVVHERSDDHARHRRRASETDEVEAAWLFNEVDDHLHSANTDPLSTSPGRYTWRAPAAAPAPIASAANRRPEISGMDGVRRRLPRLSMLDDHFEDTAPRYFRDRGDSGPGYLGSYQESAPEPSFRREDLPRRESRVPMVSASTTYLHRSEESSTSSDMYPPPLTRHDERLSPVTDSLRSRMLARLEEMDDPPHTYGELDVRAEETDIAPLLRARQAIRDEIDLLMERSNTVRRNLEARISRLGLGRPAIHSTYSRDRDIQSSTGISRSTPSESPFTFDWEGSDPTAEASTNPTHQSGTGDVGFTFDWDNRSCESSPHRLADPSPQSTEGPPFSLTWGDAEEDEVEALLSSARASRIHAHEATWSTPVVLQRYVETRRRSRDSSDNDWSMRDLLRDEHHSHLPSVSPRIIPVAAHTPDHSNSRTSIPSSASSTAVNDSRPPSHRTGHHYPSAPHSHIRHRHVDVDTRTPIPTASMPQASPNAGINLDRYHDGPFRASLERSERLRREREEMMQRITERDSIARQRVGSSYRSSGRAPSSTATSVSATDSPGSLPTQRVSSVADEPATFSRIARSRTTRLQHHHTHGLYPRHVRDDHRDIHDSITRQLRIPAARLLTPGRARDTDTLPGIAPDPSGNSEHQQQLIEDFRAQRSASASASADVSPPTTRPRPNRPTTAFRGWGIHETSDHPWRYLPLPSRNFETAGHAVSADDTNYDRVVRNQGDRRGWFIGTRRRANRDSLFGTRTFGDYMRDEDIDTSYEGLIRLTTLIGEARPQGTTRDIIDNLPSGKYCEWATPSSEQRCPICLDDYEENDPVLKVPLCTHWFHKGCLEQWLGTAKTCPVCRGPIDPNASARSSRSARALRLRRNASYSQRSLRQAAEATAPVTGETPAGNNDNADNGANSGPGPSDNGIAVPLLHNDDGEDEEEWLARSWRTLMRGDRGM